MESNTTQPVSEFAPGRSLMGAIDIGGIPRFGPQLSANLRLRQDVVSLSYDITQSRGRHFLKAGAIAEHYVSSEFNPTFSLGVYRFASLTTFLRNQPANFIGLTPEGDVNRRWPFMVYGAYLQDDIQVTSRVTANVGLRFEGSTMPRDEGGRDINMQDLLGAPVVGDLYDNPAPTFRRAWRGLGCARQRPHVGSRGLRALLQHQQPPEPYCHRDESAGNAARGHHESDVSGPPFERLTGISVRPIQYDVDLPRVHMWNASVQQEFLSDWVATVSYAGARGKHLWRNSDINVPRRRPLPTARSSTPRVCSVRIVPIQRSS